jgi:hypothetical protein
MLWIRDEFGNLAEAKRISQIVAEFVESAEEHFHCLTINGFNASRAYPGNLIDDALIILADKMKEGVHFIDLYEVIKELREEMEGPLPTGMHPVPEVD